MPCQDWLWCALTRIAEFVNRSFVINLFALLQDHDVVPYDTPVNQQATGGDIVHLVKLLRNVFSHGYPDSFDPGNIFHTRAQAPFNRLFPGIPEFDLPIDTVLEPLKNGALEYIRSVT